MPSCFRHRQTPSDRIVLRWDPLFRMAVGASCIAGTLALAISTTGGSGAGGSSSELMVTEWNTAMCRTRSQAKMPLQVRLLSFVVALLLPVLACDRQPIGSQSRSPVIALSPVPTTDPVVDSVLVISGTISDDREVIRAAYLIADSVLYIGPTGGGASKRTSIPIAPGKDVPFSIQVPLLVGPNQVEILAVDSDFNETLLKVDLIRRPPSRPQAVAVGVVHSCALLETGEVYCWGFNEAGQLGVGKQGPPDPAGLFWSLRPLPVAGGNRFTSLDAGPGSGGQGVGYYTGHTCALTADGSAYCWGYNQHGEAGTGIQGPSATARAVRAPTQVVGGLKFRSIDAGGYQTCGITIPGQAYCWGMNVERELGRDVAAEGCVSRGTAMCTAIPLPAETSQSFRSVSAGLYHTCALALQGPAFCWGIHYHGELGHNGSRYRSQLPSEPVQGGISFAQLTSGGGHTPQRYIDRGHSCGVTVQQEAYCWGANDSGQLGIGAPDTTFNNAPLRIAAEMRFSALSAGRAHTCGITEVGEALCWGRNADGQLGDGTTTQRSEPVRVVGGHRFFHLAAGWSHTCGVTVERAIYCWGTNSEGQLGTGDRRHSTQPVRVMGF